MEGIHESVSIEGFPQPEILSKIEPDDPEYIIGLSSNENEEETAEGNGFLSNSTQFDNENVQQQSKYQSESSDSEFEERETPTGSEGVDVPIVKKTFIFKCDHCDSTFEKKSGLRDHTRKCHPKVLSCKFCEEKFMSTLQVRKHCATVHGQRQRRKEDLSQKCYFCDTTFDTPRLQMLHMKSRHPKELRVALTCKICERSFPNRERIQLHLENHNGGPGFSCKLCPAKFPKEQGLSAHTAIAHKGNLQCGICQEICPSFQDYKAHKRTVHGISHNRVIHEKRFKCDICPKTFVKPSTLNLHKLKHYKKKLKGRPNLEKKKREDSSVLNSYNGSCLICHKEFLPADHELSDKEIQLEETLDRLASVLEVSPSIYQNINIDEVPAPLVCTSCHETVSFAFKFQKEMKQLEKQLNDLSQIITKDLMHSFHLDSQDLDGMIMDPVEVKLIRKTYAQCLGTCEVRASVLESRQRVKPSSTRKPDVNLENVDELRNSDCQFSVETIIKTEEDFDINEDEFRPLDERSRNEVLAVRTIRTEDITNGLSGDASVSKPLPITIITAADVRRNPSLLNSLITEASEQSSKPNQNTQSKERGEGNESVPSVSTQAVTIESTPGSPQDAEFSGGDDNFGDMSSSELHEDEDSKIPSTRKKRVNYNEYESDSNSEQDSDFDPDPSDSDFEEELFKKLPMRNKKRESFQSKDPLPPRKKSKQTSQILNKHFQCDHCHSAFETSGGLSKHIRQFHLEAIPCELCDEKFKSKLQLKQHRRTSHGRGKRIPRKCDFCSDTFDAFGSLYEHLKVVHSDQLTCKFCGTKFGVLERLQRHLDHHNGGSDFSCKLCPAKFPTEHGLITHVRISHTGNLQCGICLKMLPSFEELKSHKKSEHGMVHNASVKKKQHECKVCSKLFVKKHTLDKHMSQHMEKPTFKCPHCEQVFENRYKYKRHVMRHDTGEPTTKGKAPPKFKCNICDRDFRLQDKYDFHMKMHANPDEFISPYVTAKVDEQKNLISFDCKVCKKVFTQDSHLNSESQVEILCDYKNCSCNETFNDLKTYMYHHKKVCQIKYGREHFKATMVRRCELCGKDFPNARYLILHNYRLHPGPDSFMCQYCGRPFAKQALLDRHILKHLPDRNVQCHLCGKRVKCKGSLNSHIQHSHTNLRIPCEVCGKEFRNKTYLARHIETMHIATEAKIPCHICGKLFRTKEYVRNHIYNTHQKKRKPRENE